MIVNQFYELNLTLHTHFIYFRGQTLEQIEKFDDPRSSDEDDDEGKKFGGLGGK